MPISLGRPDGAIRKTVKSKLFDVALANLLVLTPDGMPPQSWFIYYFLDLAAEIRSIKYNVETTRDLT